MRKRIWFFIISMIVVTIFLMSCMLTSDEDKEQITPARLAKERQNEIMGCFINKDKETLKSFFSESAIENYPIDEQIDEAFNYLDDEIVSYDEPFPYAGGPVGRRYYGADTKHIITDKGTEYKIVFNGKLEFDENPKEIGVNSIKVIDMSVDYDRSKSKRENGILYIGEEI